MGLMMIHYGMTKENGDVSSEYEENYFEDGQFTDDEVEESDSDW
jgi:hypothetical protein